VAKWQRFDVNISELSPDAQLWLKGLQDTGVSQAALLEFFLDNMGSVGLTRDTCSFEKSELRGAIARLSLMEAKARVAEAAASKAMKPGNSKIEFWFGDEQFSFVTDEATADRFLKSIRSQSKDVADLHWVRDCLKKHGIQVSIDPIVARISNFQITNISVETPKDFVLAVTRAC
jgi:hypothetical protein